MSCQIKILSTVASKLSSFKVKVKKLLPDMCNVITFLYSFAAEYWAICILSFLKTDFAGRVCNFFLPQCSL